MSWTEADLREMTRRFAGWDVATFKPTSDELDAAEIILDSREGEYDWLDETPDVGP